MVAELSNFFSADKAKTGPCDTPPMVTEEDKRLYVFWQHLMYDDWHASLDEDVRSILEAFYDEKRREGAGSVNLSKALLALTRCHFPYLALQKPHVQL